MLLRFFVAILATFLQICEAQYCRGMKIYSRGLTCSQKTEIVETHNKLRHKVAQGQVQNQPRATNMQEMYWDDELQHKAQKWADECVFQHDGRQDRAVSRFPVGQNLAQIFSTAYFGTNPGDLEEIINLWFKEYQQYRYGTQVNSATGHYSQLVWADSYVLGCGYIYYLSGRMYTRYLVCNYGPAGNYIGKYPYKTTGNLCEGRDGHSPSYRRLCSNNAGHYLNCLQRTILDNETNDAVKYAEFDEDTIEDIATISIKELVTPENGDDNLII